MAPPQRKRCERMTTGSGSADRQEARLSGRMRGVGMDAHRSFEKALDFVD
jgi:hypothetical protein